MFEGYKELNTQDVERMQEVIRTLLSQTFLPERKYDKKFIGYPGLHQIGFDTDFTSGIEIVWS